MPLSPVRCSRLAYSARGTSRDPTGVLVEVGANDLVRRHPATTFARDYGRLVDGARRDAPGARIVLFNVPDVSVSAIFEDATKAPLRRLALAYNTIVAREARRIAAPVVNLFSFSQRGKTDATLLQCRSISPVR